MQAVIHIFPDVHPDYVSELFTLHQATQNRVTVVDFIVNNLIENPSSYPRISMNTKKRKHGSLEEEDDEKSNGLIYDSSKHVQLW